jgi:hypothetical protein
MPRADWEGQILNSQYDSGKDYLPYGIFAEHSLLTLEISFQYKRNPPLCQRTTVSGVTAMRDCCHPDQNRRTATQKSNKLLSLGVGSIFN